MSEQVSPATAEQIEVTATHVDMARCVNPISYPAYLPTLWYVGSWSITIDDPQPHRDWPRSGIVNVCVTVPNHEAIVLPSCRVMSVSERRVVLEDDRLPTLAKCTKAAR